MKKIIIGALFACLSFSASAQEAPSIDNIPTSEMAGKVFVTSQPLKVYVGHPASDSVKVVPRKMWLGPIYGVVKYHQEHYMMILGQDPVWFVPVVDEALKFDKQSTKDMQPVLDQQMNGKPLNLNHLKISNQ